MKIKRSRNYRKTNNRASYCGRRVKKKITEKKVPYPYTNNTWIFFKILYSKIVLSVTLCKSPPHKYNLFNPWISSKPPYCNSTPLDLCNLHYLCYVLCVLGFALLVYIASIIVFSNLSYFVSYRPNSSGLNTFPLSF